MSVCPKCGDPIPSTHSRRLGGLIDRRRKCKCGHVDRVLVQPEKIVRVLSIDARRAQKPSAMARKQNTN